MIGVRIVYATLLVARIVLPLVMIAFTVGSMVASNHGDEDRERNLLRAGTAAILPLLPMEVINPRAGASFRIFFIGLLVSLAIIIFAIRRMRLRR